MAVTFTIENETSLPDGGPLSYTITGKRGIDIGRDAFLDWALPDPTKTVSGKHCEVRYRDGGYWLHDVSRNGTFLNRSAHRMQDSHRLRDGDRIEIGRYIIAVRVDGEDAAEPGGFVAAPAAPGQYWDAAGDAAPPISPKELRPARELRPVQADFRDWAIDVPPPSSASGGYDAFSPPPPAAVPYEDMGWAQGPAASPPAPEPYLPVPTPRRPGAGPVPGGAWDAPAADAGAWGAPAAPPPAAPPPPVDAGAWGAPPAAAPPRPPPPDGGWTAPPPPPQQAPPTPPPPAAAPTVPPSGWAASPAAPPPPLGAAAGGGENPWGRSTLSPGAARPPEPPPPPAFEPPVPAVAPAAPAAGGAPSDFVARFAKGAGISPDVLGWRDPGATAEEMGALLKLATESVKQLLAGRAEAKRVARTGSHTMIQAMDNNPLKFSPTPEDALKIMLGRPSGGYLDARRAFAESFKDLKTHQVKTYSAMQHALRLLMEDLDPAAIAESQGGGGGLGGLLGSKKAKLWDLYCTRWDTLTSPHEDGMVDAFMMFFAECYDRGGGKT